MPIENERKFVLSRTMKSEALHGWTHGMVRQAYLDDGPRIREVDGVCTLTYKRWIAAAQELLEIETAISREDFEMLRSECRTALDKTRYTKAYPSGDWVVDFMQNDVGEIYFVLAEVEMPRGILALPSIPEEIAAHVVYVVDAFDDRFTNKRLTDTEYATALYIVMWPDANGATSQIVDSGVDAPQSGSRSERALTRSHPRRLRRCEDGRRRAWAAIQTGARIRG